MLSDVRARAGHKGMWARWHRERVVLDNMPHVERIAREVAPKFAAHLDIHELVQQGCVGLMQAAKRYDPATGGNFAAFAYFRIRGAIIDANRRAAYREETHDSLQAMQERGRRRLDNPRETAPEIVDPGRRVDAVIEERQAQEGAEARLRAAIAQLPQEERCVLRAALRGHSPADLAERLGLSVGMVRKRLNSARERVTAIVRGEV